MTIAYDVLAVYAALAIWGALLVLGLRRQSFQAFLAWGIVILLFLNIRYFIEGPPAAIAFFIGIYDVFDNLGLGREEGAPALAQCVDNACTVWGDRFVNHPSWGVAFHDRFLNGPQFRTNLLYTHIGFNSIAFVLMHYQLMRPGNRSNRHALIGRVSFLSLTLGVFCAVWLAAEHRSVGAYGGSAAMFGFWSMSAFVYGTAIMGVRTARRGQVAEHRKWMIRYAGSMWGAFWVFRVMLVVTGPVLRNWETASLLSSIWLSAPLGIVIAEWFRVRSIRSSAPIVAKRAPASLTGS